MKIILKGEKVESWNTYLSKSHWIFRKQTADRIHELMWVTLHQNPKFTKFDKLVDITFTAYFKGRMLDCDNLCLKPYLDGIKKHLFVDDSPKYVNSVKTISRKGKENMVEIEVIET